MNANDRNRKKDWKSQQRELARAAFPISDSSLKSLFIAVDTQVEASGCDHTLRFTKQWIVEHQQPEVPIFEWLREHGGFCDCEVVANAADHWGKTR